MDSDSGSSSSGSTAGDRAYVYCLEAVCGLCRLQLFEGEDAIAAKNDGSISAIFRFSFFRYSLDSVSEYHAVHGCHSLSQCDGNEHAMACHPACLNLSTTPERLELINALKSSFDPVSLQTELRRRWLRSQIVLGLNSWSQLPMELCHQISNYLMSEYAVTLADSMWKKRQSFSTRFKISSDLYATYVSLEGETYIASLSNTANRPNSHLLCKPSSERHIDLIYTQEDHLGIKRIIFANSTESPPAVQKSPGLWWKAIEIDEATCVLGTESDGLKLRKLKSVEPEGNLKSLVFDLPWPPDKPLRFFPFDPWPRREEPESPRMASIDLNMPGTIGISGVWSHFPISLYAHTSTDDFSFYEAHKQANASHHRVWIYVPLDQGEMVTEIWRRRSSNSFSDVYKAFVFKTSQGRVRFLGYVPHFLAGPCEWTLMEVLGDAPSRMFFNVLHDIQSIAFESPKPDCSDRQINVAPPKSPHPRATGFELFHYNSAPLADIVEVTPCQGLLKGIWTVIGLLLRYQNNHIECVGQIRRDWLTQPVAINTSESMSLGFTRVMKGPWEMCSYVFDVKFSRQVARESEEFITWFDVPWHGTLEWWFSYRQSMIYHEGRGSPQTRL